MGDGPIKLVLLHTSDIHSVFHTMPRIAWLAAVGNNELAEELNDPYAVRQSRIPKFRNISKL